MSNYPMCPDFADILYFVLGNLYYVNVVERFIIKKIYVFDGSKTFIRAIALRTICDYLRLSYIIFAVNTFLLVISFPVFLDRFTTATSNGVDSGSSADSGVYEFATQPQHHPDTRPSVDNLSVVSSVSTLSSEDGSDFGVSLSYDPKTSPEKTTGNMYLNVLKKNKSQQQHNQPLKLAAGVELTKVNFTGSKTPKTNAISTNQPIKIAPVKHVTQTHSSETKRAELPKTDVVDSGSAASKSLSDWTIEDVCKWLKDLGMEAYTGVFSENEIVGSHLPDLNKEDLQELGITRLGHRLTIEKALKKLTGK